MLVAVDRTCTGCRQTKPIEEFHRKATGRYGRKARCRDCEAQAQKLIDRSKYLQIQYAWMKRNPEKIRAYKKVGRAIKSGVLVRPDRCSGCGQETKVQAHHEDYSKPLEVRWLCQPCHKAEHA